MRRLTVFSLGLLLLASQASALKFFYEHGIGANNSSFGFAPSNPSVCNGPSNSLCELLAGTSGGGVSWGNDYSNGQSDPTQMPSYTQTIPAQARNTLIPSLTTRLAASEPYVLVGLSQGGLRARYALQNSPSLQGQARALVTFDSPHGGAPIARNLPVYKKILADDIGDGTVDILSLDQVIESIAPNAGSAGQLLKLRGDEPGLQDLVPDSNFMDELNHASSCHYVFAPGTSFIIYYICEKDPNVHPLPDNVNLISVWGEGASPLDPNKKNTIEAALTAAGAQQLRSNLDDNANTANGWGWFFLFTPLGAPLRDLASHLWNFDEEWRTQVVGAQEGDGVVPKDSQLFMQNDLSLGGKRPVPPIQSQNWHSNTQNDQDAVRLVVKALRESGSLD